ncbi:uncharacterized protein LOC104894104 isoform X2 [Beta vulgaris subsp. vulgaris]|uniref:uncharacterized protein LOC104894104 isoform X2 n=1 Tax=Beta vulgaris subsp. vulgaris TaxID=3555 RepID=UPI002036F315|nr:uncharacterized protein LOC104894104 isoform X2 [Beta vulgaris subsp. vulgaris]
MDHSWRPHAIQGNICPTCSISHFPFCPPNPHPSAYAPPNMDPISYPINMNRPTYYNPGDPYYDPGHFHKNPSLPHVGNFGAGSRGPYSMQNPGFGDGGYTGNDYNNVSDRSSKRLRVDGTYPRPYGAEVDANYHDDGRVLRLVHDHGGPNSGFGFGRDVRGSVVESSGFDRNVGGQDPRMSSDFGMRPLNDMEMNNAAGSGYGVDYKKDEIDYHTGYGSQYRVKRSTSDVEQGSLGNKFQNQYEQVSIPPDPTGLYQGGVGHDYDRQSQGYHHSSYGSSHGSNENFYGRNMESLHSNGVSMHYDQRSNVPPSNHYSSSHPSLPSAMHQPGQLRCDYGSPHLLSDVRQPIEIRPPPIEAYQVPISNQNVPPRSHYGLPHMDHPGGYANSVSENMGHLHASQGFDVQPPLPASPPPRAPPLPMEPPGRWPAEYKPSSSSPRVSSSLFPVPVGSTATVHSSHALIPEPHIQPHSPIPKPHTRTTPHLLNSQLGQMARGGFQGDPQGTLTSYGQYVGDGQKLLSKQNIPDKPKTIDAAHLFKPPHRTSRSDHFVIILRGLPGSGKSYLAKMLRDLEVEHGGSAPRIHSMDDYFMTEVEKVEENETSKSSVRVKKPTMKKVLEYCYEPEMEEAYRLSMLKAFKKTLEEGAFTFVIVDDRNLRVADFAQFWATAKRSGYEVYVLEAPYKDPAGCTARNVHGFTQVDVEKMAAQWEEAPSMYLQLDVKSIFHGDDLKESNIEEVDMDTEDGDVDGDLFNLDETGAEIVTSSAGSLGPYVKQKDERSWDAEVGYPTEEVKDLGRSKWSDDWDDDDDKRTEALKGKASVLSGFVRTYGKEGKSVHWGDQNANPLLEENAATRKSEETKKHNMFQERLRAEQESFKAVFDKRRQRIGGLAADED